MSERAPATRCQRWVRRAQLWTVAVLLPSAGAYLLHVLSSRGTTAESTWDALVLALVWAAVLVEYGPMVCPEAPLAQPPAAAAPAAEPEAAPPPG